MAESVVSSVVSGVATRLGNLLLQEAIYLNGVRDNVQELQTELTLMQCFLKDADARQNESAIVKQSLAEMKDLAYDAEDVIATYALTVASRKGGGVQKALKRCCSIFDEGVSVHKVGSKIDSIKTRVSSLKQSFQDYGIIRESIVQAGGPSSSNETQREQRQTFSHLEDDPVGFNDNLNELVEFLLKQEEGKRVASICGMGGLGKTTLAKMVYNHKKVKQHFGRRAWVYISQQCQRRQVWEDILIGLSQMRKDEIRKLNEADIVDKLCQVQKERKCLVILDDIWNDETWNNLHQAFPLKDTKSKILITSRIQQVSRHVDPGGFLYELQPLNDVRSLELLEKIAISRRKDSVIKTYMEEYGKEIIGYCGGLPLAITILGGLLATKQIREEWEDVLRHVKSYLYEEQNLRVKKVLGLSYNDLPWHLKPCFLYLAHFPEDFEIRTKELIRMWIAEGFISQIQHGGREDTIEDVGDRYLRDLVERCMVLVGERDTLGRISTCRMHDLMRDFCVSKAQEENFLHITNILSMKQREEQIGKVRRLAIISESGGDSCKGIKFNEYPYLRSLLHLLPDWHHESYFKESSFKKFKLVRVLHLELFKNHDRKLPKDIGCLIHLRYLSLKDSRVCTVPSSIGNLRCLETLDLRINFYPPSNRENLLGKLRLYFSIPRVPNVFKYMKQLKHLYLPSRYRVSGKLELGHLRLQTLVNVQPNTIQIPAGFKFKHLRDLRLDTDERPQDDSLHMLVSICPHIYKLTLHDVIKKFPEAHQFSPNIVELTMRNAFLKEDPMTTLEKFPNLKRLFVGYKVFVGKIMVCSERGFPRLQYLYLFALDDLEEWRVEEGAMPSLQRLGINDCMELRMIPDGLRFITTLQELQILRMPKSFKDRLDKGGPDFEKVQHVPSLVFENCDKE